MAFVFCRLEPFLYTHQLVLELLDGQAGLLLLVLVGRESICQLLAKFFLLFFLRLIVDSDGFLAFECHQLDAPVLLSHLANQLLYLCVFLLLEALPLVVERLDHDTSGLHKLALDGANLRFQKFDLALSRLDKLALLL